MKKLLGVAALATIIASPAFAQTVARQAPAQSNFYNQNYERGDGQRHSVNPGFDVYQNDGRYAGSDPDANIRLELRRDNDRNPN